VTVVQFPKADHLFIDGAGRPTPLGYEKPGRVDSDVIATITAWIKKVKAASWRLKRHQGRNVGARASTQGAPAAVAAGSVTRSDHRHDPLDSGRAQTAARVRRPAHAGGSGGVAPGQAEPKRPRGCAARGPCRGFRGVAPRAGRAQTAARCHRASTCASALG
jgi:hypothetical protein